MQVAVKNLSVQDVSDGKTVNLACLILLQSGSLDTAPGWGNCRCVVCEEHRARQQHGSDTGTGAQ